MGKKDPRVDAYISKSADFAQPILRHLSALVHDACPPVEETLKWGTPHFVHKGNLCGMAAFKHHCAFLFWKGSLIFDSRRHEAMGHFGRITKVADLPSRKVMLGYIKQAVKLNEAGIKPARLKPKGSKPLVIPPSLSKALAKNGKARAAFDEFSPSNKREYAEWIAEAKGDDTRKRRLDTALKWIAEGKPRNWKYRRS